MRRMHQSQSRRGSILPMVTVCLVALLGFVALAVDIGLLLVARAHCQNAADCGAMAGARTLNGDVNNNNNYSAAAANSLSMSTACKVMSDPIQPGWVKSEIGYYTYNRVTRKFGPILPSAGGAMPSNENWSLCRVRVDYSHATSFARVLGINTYETAAVATAVHRPRDISIVLDFSGSMSFDSLLAGAHTGNRTKVLNPETVFPTFGHYTGYNPTPTSGFVISSGELLGLSNLVTATNAGPAVVNDFSRAGLGQPFQVAFTAQPNSYATAPLGDVPLRGNNNNPTAQFEDRLSDVIGTTARHATFESEGYSAAFLNGGTPKTFSGFTMGPRYWGKTFFIWPPDPRPAHDWRRKFFLKADKTSPVDDNSLLWTTGTAPVVKVPRNSSTTNYFINYAAILRWLLNTGPNPFPSQLRAGRIRYYSAFPNVSNPANDAAFNERMYVTNPTDLNERFWKHYIDFVLGFQQTGNGPVYNDVTRLTGYFDDLNWGALNISAKPTGSDTRYMNYIDNPPRPKTKFWFGPMTLLDFIDNYNQGRRWMPGTAHQAPLWACKVGMRAAIYDIEKNHPNDYACLSYYSTPKYSASDTTGVFNRIRTPLGRDYKRMVDSLFYPEITIDNPVAFPEISCYDANNMLEAPRGNGGTCMVMGLMQTFNQFSANPILVNYNVAGPPGDAGGLGRVGAQKVVLFMTDGVANTPANAALTNAGSHNSYYQIRIPGEYPSNSGTVTTQLYNVANQLCALDTAPVPGYSTARKPVLIHSIAFGSLFDPAETGGASTARNNALTILQTLQFIGKTQNSASEPLPDYKRIIGTPEQRIDRMQHCFQKIMQDTVSVTLIE